MPDFKRVTSNWKEIGRQFWTPLVIAILWAVGRHFYPGESIRLISDFATAFFLASWMYGQYNRIDRQSDTTERLKSIQLTLTESSEASARAAKHQQELAASLTRLSEFAVSPPPQFRQAIADTIRAAQLANSEQQTANTALMAAVSNIVSNAMAWNPGANLSVTIRSDDTQPTDQNGNRGGPTPNSGGTTRSN